MHSNLFSRNMVSLSHKLFAQVIAPGDLVVDATCGNGQDSLQLARLLKGLGRLVMYDIQEQAIHNTKQLLHDQLTEDEIKTLEFKLQSHEHICEQGAKLVHYNLGYLPRSDKSITTMVNSTMISIQKALSLLCCKGCVSVVCYPGHDQGAKETCALESFAQTLSPQQWQVHSHVIMNRHKSPRLLIFQALQ